MSFAQFEKLPPNPAYKYEFFDGHAWLTPRPKMYHALLDLRSFANPVTAVASDEEVGVRPLADEDWDHLPRLFAAAFDRVQPFSTLADGVRVQAARECLQRTKEGGEGPLIADASLTAAHKSDDRLIGAILTTLVPAGDPTEWDSWHWSSPPPPGAVAQRIGRPHLTWIFVSPWHAGRGVGTALLEAAVRGLTRLGYAELASTFLLGNESSTLWHWRAGFRLLPYPGSMRLIRQRIEEREQAPG